MNLEIAMENAVDGNPGSMHYHIVELIYNELLSLRNDSGVRNAFRFTAIPIFKGVNSFADNPIVKDILNDSLTFSNPSKFNDPMDPIVREWINVQKASLNEKEEKSIFRMMSKVLTSNMRMACLSTPIIDRMEYRCAEPKVTDCSLLMWAHYAKMHKGICIEYCINEEVLCRYNNESQL